MRDPDKPQQIIEAAIRVFARTGYYSSRVSDIAREAGIASGTIYLYFKTKDEILVTLFREKMAEFVSGLRKDIAGEPDAPAKLRRRVPRRPAGEGRDQDALRRHGPAHDVLGARQARLSARRRRGARGQHLPQRSHPRWDLKRSCWRGRRRPRSSRSTARPPTPSAGRSCVGSTTRCTQCTKTPAAARW